MSRRFNGPAPRLGPNGRRLTHQERAGAAMIGVFLGLAFWAFFIVLALILL